MASPGGTKIYQSPDDASLAPLLRVPVDGTPETVMSQLSSEGFVEAYVTARFAPTLTPVTSV